MIDDTNRNTALASALVDELGRAGVTHAVLSPGSRSTPLALALDSAPGIELTVVLDERVAGFAALGISLATGRPVAVACTSGSAAANLHPAMAEADQAGVPLIVLTSDRPPELRGIGAGQTIDQIGLYGSASRWFCEGGTHDADDAGLLHMRSIACRAVGEATLGRGPVHLNLSWRDPLGPEPVAGTVSAADPLALEGRSEGRPLTVPIPGREPSAQLLDATAEAIARAERPLIVAGRDTRPGLAAAIARLAGAIGAPILADTLSQLRGGAREQATILAAYDLILRSPPEGLEPDLVLRFGDMPTSKPLRTWLGRAGGPDQIVVDPPGRWNEPTRRAGALIRAEAIAVATALAERSTGADGTEEWTDVWATAERAASEAIEETLAALGSISEPALHRRLGSIITEGDQVLLASSMPVRDAEAFVAPGGAEATWFCNRGANGIDGTISTGAGLARGGRRPTWVILGDLTFAHDVGGLALVAEAPAPIRIVVIDNGGGGIFDFLPQAGQIDPARFELLFSTPSRIDVLAAARAFGVDYAEIGSLDDLADLADSGSIVAHARVDRGGNVELHRRIAKAVADAVG
jgi:2-succinyl-5-enolpyruvyl-6-hydroxy-3-cyclohexene-1-carboxylate synthase